MNELLADPQYSWGQPAITGTPPAERSDHSAIVALGDNMIVFGGHGVSNMYNDVWRLYYDSLLPGLRWTSMDISGTPPDPGFGHSAIYDASVDTANVLLQRMIVFGGTSGTDQNPTDSDVWELRFNPSSPNAATWYKMAQVTLGTNGKPSPRYWHTMNGADTSLRVRPATTDTAHVALMFGGKLDASTNTNSCTNELWKLWIFKNRRVGWELVTPGGTPPSARARHSTVLDPDQSGYGARIYVYGGIKGNGDPADSHVHVLDPWGGQYASWAPWADLGISLAGQTSVLDHDQQVARVAEVFSPVDTMWHEQTNATLWETFYPPVFLVPGGANGDSRVINVGNFKYQTYSLDIPPTGQAGSWNWLLNGYTGFRPQGGVQYRPGHIMLAGGQNTAFVATGITKTFDTSNLDTSWVDSESMVARMNANLVLLPTGKVLAVGGNQLGESSLPVKWPQMWDPAENNDTGGWSSTTNTETRLAEQPTTRPNHSTAILLPDGRVLSAGGDGDQEHTDSDQHMADIFYPPYLFEADNETLLARPTFSNSAKPESLGFGKIFTICVPDTAWITRACLIRPAATTHGFDQNGRYVPLNFTTAGSPMRLFVTSPASPDSAPPGDYMLFLTGKGAIATSLRSPNGSGSWRRDSIPAIRFRPMW